MIEVKPGATPIMSFSVGVATMTYAFLPELQMTGLNDIAGIAALTAIISPFAAIGKVCLARLAAGIGTPESAAPEKD